MDIVKIIQESNLGKTLEVGGTETDKVNVKVDGTTVFISPTGELYSTSLSIVAGSGLSGGGASGVITLDVNVDESTLTIFSDTLLVKDFGIVNSKLGNSSVTSTKLADTNVLFSKIQNIPSYTVIGRTDAGTGISSAIPILNENDLASNSPTSLVTQSSVKAYVDAATYWSKTGSLVYYTGGNVAIGTAVDSLNRLTVAGSIEYSGLLKPGGSSGSNGMFLKRGASDNIWSLIQTTDLSDFSSRFDTLFAAKSTSNLTEGSNLYYTDARVLTIGNATYSLLSHNHTLDSLSNVTITANSASEILSWSGSAWINRTITELGLTPDTRTITINGTSGRITSSAGAQNLTANRTWTLDLATVGTAGTYTKVTTDAYGRVTSGVSTILAADISNLTSTLDTRYLRKDANDNNSTFTLTTGNLVSTTATINSTFTLPSLAVGSSDDILIVNGSGVVQKKTLTIAGNFGIANSAGVNQFNVALGTNLRFEGANDTTVTFDSGTNKVIISSVPGSGGGGAVTSFNTRTGAIVPQAGDYTTSIVNEGSNLYFTEARVRSTPLTGYTVGSNTAILATDTVLQAFGKTQAQINALTPSSRTLTINGTASNIAVTGGTQDLTANRTWTVNLIASGVTAGTYTKLTVDTFGRATVGASLIASDIPNLDASKITTGVFPVAQLGTGTPSASTYLAGNGIWTTFPTLTNGTVTSVALTVPSFLSVTGSPITTSGTLAVSLANQSANTWFGNSTGSSAAPTFNALAALTKTDDTNVTLTLGGTPATALNKAVSLTLGWTGVLAIARGGTGLSSLGTANQLLRVNAGATALEYFTPTYISANQTISFTPNAGGDVTGSASGTTSLTPTLSIGANKVTLAQMAQIASSRFLGRITASTGNVEVLTGTQATTLLDTFSSSLKGLVPASGGGTTNFLRADGTWVNPSGGSVSGTTNTLAVFTSATSVGDSIITQTTGGFPQVTIGGSVSSTFTGLYTYDRFVVTDNTGSRFLALESDTTSNTSSAIQSGAIGNAATQQIVFGASTGSAHPYSGMGFNVTSGTGFYWGIGTVLTGVVTYMRMFSSGNVAIGNTNIGIDAGYKLDVDGTARVTSTLTIGSIGALGSPASTFLTHSSGVVQSRTAAQVLSDIGAYSSSNPSGYITANQSITFTPSGDVTGSASGTTSLTPTLTIGNNVVTLTKLAQISTARILGRVTASTGNVESLTGTQATTLLDTFTTSLKGLVPASGGGTTNFLRADGTWSAPAGGLSGSGTSGYLAKYTGASTLAISSVFEDSASLLLGAGKTTGAFTINTEMDVRIGGGASSNTDTYNIKIDQGGGNGMQIKGYTSSTLQGAIEWGDGGTGLGYQVPSGKRHTFYIDGFPKARLFSTGFLAVGTVGADNGYTIQAYSGSNSGDGLYVQGKILATDDIKGFSDRRLKTNIVPLGNSLDKVKAISGYSYTYNGETKYGVIADEIQAILPYAVNKHGKYYTVTYNSLDALFVESIKSLALVQESQEEKIERLEKRIKQLEDGSTFN